MNIRDEIFLPNKKGNFLHCLLPLSSTRINITKKSNYTFEIFSENHTRGPGDLDFENSLDHHKTVIARDTMVGFLTF